jgi:(p)ppGpp synthase/HD superfamily hydrolase
VDGLETLLEMTRTDFVERSSLSRAALDFATSRHAGQTRDMDSIPFVTHPVEVACLLHEAGYSDEVVASSAPTSASSATTRPASTCSPT